MKAGTLKDGFGIQVGFGTGESGTDHSGIMLLIDPTSVTPPGADGGDAIDTVTHSNTEWRTKHPKSLIEITDGAFTVVWDPADWTAIKNLVNDNALITFTFPTGDSVAFFGYVKNFTPSEYVEGEEPTAECTIVVTNYDHDTGLEAGPELTTASA